MGREDVEASLKNQEPGTFIIRFSERFGGQFAIAFIGTEQPLKIKHYLMQPNEYAVLFFFFCNQKINLPIFF